MILIIGTIRIPAGSLAAARPAMERMIAASRAEAGCHAYAYAEDVLEPGLIRVTEYWSEQATLDRHFASAHIQEWRAQWPALGISDRALHAYQVDEGQKV